MALLSTKAMLSAFQQIAHKYAAIKPIQNDILYDLCKTARRLG